MCKAVPEKRGVVFRTKRPGACSMCSASRCRIRENVMLPLCGAPSIGLPETQKEVFLCPFIPIPFPKHTGVMLQLK